MKRSYFKRPTYEDMIAAQNRKKERQLAKREKLKELKAQGRVKPKPDRMKTLKTKLWQMFSKYIRKSYANENGMVLTCDGKWVHWQETDCGHLYAGTERSQSGGGNELWYYENNFAPQSNNGNRFNAEDSAKVYMAWAIKKYGIEEVEHMGRLKQIPRKFTEEELQAKYLYYKDKFARL